MGELDHKIGSMTRLLVAPDIDAAAKRAVSRQVGGLESEREGLQQAVAQLADDANDNPAGLATAVRQALAEARQSLAAVASPTEMRDSIEQHVWADVAHAGQEDPAEARRKRNSPGGSRGRERRCTRGR